MRTLSAALVLVTALATPARADIKGCYERVYSAAHLHKHRGQKVTMMRLQIGLTKDIDSAQADKLWATFRNGRSLATWPLECSDNHRCFVEGDGGSFHIDETADGVKISNEGYIRFGDDEDYIEVPDDTEHRVFLLKRVGAGCK